MDELVQTSTEVSRAMYLTCSSLLHHFIVCSTPSPTQRNPSPHSTDFCPRDESIYPACWAYIFSVVSIYTYYAEYIDPSANLRKLNALKALPYLQYLPVKDFFFRFQLLFPSIKAFADKTETAETGL